VSRLLFLLCASRHCHLPSFPPRRSSDLGDARPPLSRHEVLEAFLPYVQRELARGTHLHAMSRHILGLFQGQPGARAFRRHISEKDRKSTRLNSSHVKISYAVFCLKKKKN